MKVFENERYMNDVETIAKLNIPWEILQNASIIITGASGLIGSCFVDIIMKRNFSGLNCKVYALGRNESRAKERFSYCWDNEFFNFFSHDINLPLPDNHISSIDYVLHLASNTHPVVYATDPIGTITTNIIGTKNILDFAYKTNAKRTVFASSVEIYGENCGNVDRFDEKYCGYIDSNTMRAGYPESKRCGESLCQAYIRQKNMDIVIPRLTRTYGPTLLMDDSKAISQFIRKGVYDEDIVLKSKGTQYYTYTYVTDVVSALLHILFFGKCGEAYNVSDINSEITLKDLATIIANYIDKKVIFEVPNEVEREGFSKATKALMESRKLNGLGWNAKFDIKNGIERTISILKECSEE